VKRRNLCSREEGGKKVDGVVRAEAVETTRTAVSITGQKEELAAIESH